MKRFGRNVAESLAAERAAEYREVVEEVEAGLAAEPGERNRALRRLRSEYRRIERRDYFPLPEKIKAQEALERLAASLESETTP